MKLKDILFAGLLLSAVIYLGYFVQQSEFFKICIGYSAAFVSFGYFLIQSRQDRIKLKHLVFLAITARIALIGAFPSLSDDIFRFIWDGRLIINGINPFSYLPTDPELLTNPEINYDTLLLEQLNSPNYFSVYPPANQLIFLISSFLSQGDILSNAVLIRLFIIAFEVGTIIYLPIVLVEYGIKKANSIYYILNPLIIVELTGNLHFEAGMVFFFVLFALALRRKKNIKAAAMIGLSISLKLLPLLFLPSLLRRLKANKLVLLYAIAGLVFLLPFTPFLSMTLFQNIGSSLDLYIQKFEFNGSLYYLLRFFGYKIYGFNLIHVLGPILALVSLVSIFSLSLVKKMTDYPIYKIWFWSFLIYLVCAMTIHPWYLSMLILLNCFMGFRFVHIWSFLITLTYINYNNPVYQENLTIVFCEYFLAMTIMLIEIKTKKKAETT